MRRIFLSFLLCTRYGRHAPVSSSVDLGEFLFREPNDRSMDIEQVLAAGQFAQVDACSTAVDAEWSHLWPAAASRTRQE
jgi:hypothetical protein